MTDKAPTRQEEATKRHTATWAVLITLLLGVIGFAALTVYWMVDAVVGTLGGAIENRLGNIEVNDHGGDVIIRRSEGD